VLEVLLHKGPLPVNTIGPVVDLTAGSISIAVDRLVEKGLVSRDPLDGPPARAAYAVRWGLWSRAYRSPGCALHKIRGGWQPRTR
jgi:predicted transcriptional regulator